jgi:hypothetical protein
MSPLPDELRSTLREHARIVEAPPDPFTSVEERATRMRRRRWLAVGAAGMGTACVAIGITVALSGGEDAVVRVPQPVASSAPSPTPETDGPAPVNILRWTERAEFTDAAGDYTAALADGVTRTSEEWARAHDAPETSSHLLWAGTLPDGRLALAIQIWETGSAADAWTVFAVIPSSGEGGVLVSDRPTWFQDQKPGEPVSATKEDVSRITQLSTVIESGGQGGPIAVVIAKHTTDTIAYGPDAAHAATVPSVDGVAVFTPKAPADPSRGVVVVRDHAGEVTYAGPIDLGTKWPNLG